MSIAPGDAGDVQPQPGLPGSAQDSAGHSAPNELDRTPGR